MHAVIVTVGEEGAWLVDDGPPELLASHRVDAVDTVGAGDAFCGALGARLAAGAHPPPMPTLYANAAAALSVTKPGAKQSIPASRHRRPSSVTALRLCGEIVAMRRKVRTDVGT